MQGLISNLPQVDGHPVPQSPVVPMPARSTTSAPGQRYLMIFMRYAGVGIIGTMVHFLILALLVEFITAVAASTTGAIAGCITNFRLAKAFVFTARPADTFAFQRFVTVAIGGIAMNTAMMVTLTPLLPVYVSQMAASAVVLMSGFLLNSAWTFGEYRS